MVERAVALQEGASKAVETAAHQVAVARVGVKAEGMVAAVASCEAVRVYSYRKYGGATEKLIDSRIEAALAEREVEDE